MPFTLQPPRVLVGTLLCCLVFATSACVAPEPRIVLNRRATVHRSPPAQAKTLATPKCKPAARARLTEAEKARLFADFDDWRDERRPAGTTAETALPPPAPPATRAAPPGCSASAN